MFEGEIQRIGERALDLLRMAAILGTRFEAQALILLAEEREDIVLSVLDGAVRFGFVAEDSGVAGQYRFAQAYLPEVLRGGYTSARLRVLHRRAADALLALEAKRTSAG